MFLVRLWVHRMTFVYHVWYTSGCHDALHFSDDMLRTYTLPDDLEAFIRDAQGETLARARQVDALRPRI